MNIEYITVAMVSILFYWLLEHQIGGGYVKRHEHVKTAEDLTEHILSVEDSFTKFRTKYTTRFGREAKEQQARELEEIIPAIIGRLNLTDKQKQVLENIPPSMIVSFLKKQKLL